MVRSAHFGNLFVAITNAELRNKMELYIMDQPVLVIKTFYSSNGSCAAVERQCCEWFSFHVTPSSDTIYQTGEQSEKKNKCL